MLAVLSDLDGTLVDSTVATERVWRRWLDEQGVAGPERHPHGVPARQVVAMLAPHLDAAEAADELARREVADREGVVPLPGASALLDGGSAVAGGLGVPLAVVTSCTRELAAVRLEAAGLVAPPTVVTAEDTPVGKPDPAPYLLGAARLGVPAERCVVLEDAPAGVAAGRAAGMRVVALRTTHGDDELAGAHEIHDDVAAFLASRRDAPADRPTP